jgi:hypothetical protein
VYRKVDNPISGVIVSVSADSVTVVSKIRNLSIARADVARVVTRRSGHWKWIGLGVGAGAGAGVGAAIGARLANESAGDIDIKAASTAALAVAGGLIGLGIGAALDSRHSTVYVAH